MEIGIGSQADLVVGQQIEAEFLLELLGIINSDEVSSRNLQDFVPLLRGTQDCRHFGHEQALAGPAAGQECGLLVAPWIGAQYNRDLCMAPAYSEVGVLYHDR